MDFTSTLNPGTPPPEGFLLSDPDDWEYFAEGASNCLFRYTGAHPYFRPFLLRLRKHLPGSPTTQQLYEHLTTRFSPLLGEYLLHHSMIELDPSLIPELNKRLPNPNTATEDWAGRPVKARTRFLETQERFGMLVEDMSCGNYLYDEEIMEDPEGWRDMAAVEFKPKWLTQSPNAPLEWMLCRTCAVRHMNHGKPNDLPSGKKKEDAMEDVEDEDEDEDDEEDELPEYCPLDLASGNRSRIEAAVYAIVNNPNNSIMIADPTPPDSDSETGSIRGGGAGGRSIGSSGNPSSSSAAADTLSAEDLAHQLAKALETSLVTLLTHFFVASKIIPLLAKLQDEYGARGVFTSATLQLMSETESLPSAEALAQMALESKGEVNDIWKAMTLRDCSLFLKIWARKRIGRGMEARIEAKVADLDLKTGDGGRAVYWRDVERRLRKGGWYGNINRGGRRNCRTGEGKP